MQVIARLIRIRQLGRHALIPQHGIEIQHGIKRSRMADKLIDFQPRLFTQIARVRLQRGVATRCGKRRDGGREDGDPKSVNARRDLPVRGHEAGICEGLVGDSGGRDADVVDAFEDHGVAHAGVRKDISVDAGEDVGSEAVVEDAVAAGGEVGYG